MGPLTHPDPHTTLEITMNNPLFSDVLKRRLELTQAVLGRKGDEYVRGGDRYSNFKHAAAYLKVTPERALIGMRAKHEISLMDIINDIDADKLPTIEMLEEKIGDNIAYLILLEGILKERILNAPSR